MMCKGYNGWINRETWTAALWLDGDELYDLGRDLRVSAIARARQAVANGRVDDLASHARSLWSYYVAGNLESLYGYDSDLWRADIVNNSMAVDLLQIAFSRISWREIADGIVDDLIFDDGNWLYLGDDEDDVAVDVVADDGDDDGDDDDDIGSEVLS